MSGVQVQEITRRKLFPVSYVSVHCFVFSTFQGHSDAVTSACFSCDGNIIATTSSNGDFRLWTIANDNIYIENVAHDLGIQNCDFSQNLNPIPHQPMRDAQDYLLSTCGNDSLVKLWKIVTPKVRRF